MREVKAVLGARIMIKALEDKMTTEGGLEISDDGESLPLAEVIDISDEVTRVEVGDVIHYMKSRESGKCRHKGEEYFIIPVGQAVAIVDE